MSDHGGKRSGAGRKEGSQNKFSLSIKESVLDTFKALGGVEHMTEWARENTTEFYKIAARLIPNEMSHSGEINSTVTFLIKDAD